MKKLFFVGFFFFISFFAFSQINFDDYFVDKSLRFDYIHGGNADSEYLFLQQIKEEEFWGGSKTALIDTFRYGDYMLMVYDSTSNSLIYSRGYSTLFREWQEVEEATVTNRSFYEVVTFPFPKKTVKLVFEKRNAQNVFLEIATFFVNPTNYFISPEKPFNFPASRIFGNRDYHKALDIVIIPDGYTKAEMEKFRKDCERYVNLFFKVSPFKENKDRINFWAVEAASEQSGTDIPGTDVWKNTILSTHFYTFNSERYLTCPDIKTLRDLCGLVPYDQIYILVNTSKYGGGGIYNYYNLCSSDHAQSEQVFTHEFGHAFGALADEYEYGFDNADELYDPETEIYAPNITNLVDFEKKWKHLVSPGTPIPTPPLEKFKNTIGAFEGAGYVTKGVYRPMQNCKMRTNEENNFCPICHKVVLDLLKFYTE